MNILLASPPVELEAGHRFRDSICAEEMDKPMPGADHGRRELRNGLDQRAIQPSKHHRNVLSRTPLWQSRNQSKPKSSETEQLPAQGRYAPRAAEVVKILDDRVEDVYRQVREQPFWNTLMDTKTSTETCRRIFREIFLAIYWYQQHTTEAGFHMIGRLPGSEETMLNHLMLHKIEAAGLNGWGFHDHQLPGDSVDKASNTPMPSTCYANTGVWWRMTNTENPWGNLGAEYLFEHLTKRAAQALVPVFQRHGLQAEGLKFIIDHATEDAKHGEMVRQLISEAVTRHPESEAAMIRCFDYFRQVYPIPVWTEAYKRAIKKPSPPATLTRTETGGALRGPFACSWGRLRGLFTIFYMRFTR